MKIYWDKNLRQIRTKDGECLMDKNHQQSINDSDSRRICALDDRVCKAVALGTSKVDTLRTQLQCSAKTQGKHKMVFNGINTKSETPFTIMVIKGSEGWRGAKNTKLYAFKCSVCGLEITKTENELSKTEKEALKKLKLL